MATRKTRANKRNPRGAGTARPASRRSKKRNADHRLPRSVRPEHVRLDVELAPQRSDRFRGTVSIAVDVASRTDELVLNAAELRVSKPRVTDADGRSYRARLVVEAEAQRIRVQLGEMLPAGPARLELNFAGRLRRDLCGLYGVRVGEHRYAFTQLEPADARKFFPCFDEPSMKARWEISVTLPSEDTALSNAPIARTERHSDGRTTTHFEPTPPLSSYLVALAVGPLECSAPRRVGETDIRVWHVPGKAALCAFGLEAGAQTLARLERYFALPYPYAKLDLVAVPDFEFGAMENAGAVFFRETLLLLDPESATLAEKKRAAEVICHELAHMWYGDLVTMEWWDDLWLNEAFATWMAFHVVDQWKPEWKMWHDFQHHRAAALDLDSLRNTHPIYTPVRTPEEANENFDLITYEKGASVVRMLERYLGASIFRKGVRRYVRRHAEGNAVASDLWTALAEAAGRPVEPIVRAWIEQEGYPVVRVSRPRGQRTADRLVLFQERFQTSTPPKTGRSQSAGPRWPVPWVGRQLGARGRGRTLRHLFSRRRETLEVEAGPVYGNADEGGFFRPLHGGEALEALLARPGRLRAVERMGLVDHQWALAHAGLAPLASLFDTVQAFARDRDPDVLAAIQRALGLLTNGLAAARGPACEGRQRAWVGEHFAPLFDELGWDTPAQASDEERLRRAAALQLAGPLARRTDVLDEALERCRVYLADRGRLDPNLADPLVSAAALTGGETLYESFAEAMRQASTPQDQRRFLLALCDFPEPVLVERTLRITLGDEVATQDVAFVLVRLFANPAARDRTWRFLKRRWPRLRKRIAPLLLPRIIAATPALGTPAARRDVAAFFRANPVPSGERTLRQSLERFDAELRFRRRAGPELEALLDA